MAAFNYFKNMYDVDMKPRLLRTLIKERVPDDKHPFENPAELSTVVSLIKTHGLLSESFSKSTDQKLVDNWKSAVDSWVERVLLLVSNNMVFINIINCSISMWIFCFYKKLECVICIYLYIA